MRRQLNLFDFWLGHFSAMLGITKWFTEFDYRHAGILLGVTALCVGWAIMRRTMGDKRAA
jgi:hypothetical protein